MASSPPARRLCLAGSRFVYLTFDGLRESRTIADKQTRIRITLPVAEVTQLLEVLAEVTSEPDHQELV